MPGSFFLTSYSAETGERLWWVSGLSFEMKSKPAIDRTTMYLRTRSALWAFRRSADDSPAGR